MKKIIKKSSLYILILLFILISSYQPPDITGKGTPENPFVIYSFSGLEKIGNPQDKYPLDANYVLGNDIDAQPTAENHYNQGQGWQPIASSENPFQGKIDGQNYEILNLNINLPRGEIIGLFARTKGAVIKNLGLRNIKIIGKEYVGGLTGINSGTISNSYVQGKIKSKFISGGLAGWNFAGQIENSHFEGQVKGKLLLGGLTGRSSSGKILHSKVKGQITGDDRNIGGLTGDNTVYSTIEDSHVEGKITGYERIGGLAGLNNGTINNSQFQGQVKGDWLTDSLVGWSPEGTIENSQGEEVQ
ncbi:MAG: GLUG motif-containing protein [bacterium]